MKPLWHRGEIGDILYSWFMLHCGAKVADFTIQRHSLHGTFDQYEALRGLAALQPYLRNFEHGHNWQHFQDDLRPWIDGLAPCPSQNIIRPYFTGHAVEWTGYRPWLVGVARRQLNHAYTVFNVTGRYRDANFKWGTVMPAGIMYFIGLPAEYEAFVEHLRSTGYASAADRLSYYPTADFLSAAELIAGADAFFGNASACLALAQGLGHPRIYVEATDLTRTTCLFGHEKVLNV